VSGLIPLLSINGNRTDSEAIRYAKNKVKENPHEAGSHFYLGCLLYHLAHDVNGAITEFEKCLVCDPHFLEGYKSLAYCLLEVKKDKEAEKTLKKAMKIIPDDSILLFNYAELLKRTQRYDEARYFFKKAFKFEKESKIKKKIQKSIAGLDDILNQAESSPQWAMAKKDCCRSSSVKIDKANKMIGISHQISSPFTQPINQTLLPDIPSPIAAGDMIVFPDSSLTSFKAVNAATIDETAWKSVLLADRLAYASTPVYVPPYLFFSIGNSLRRLDLRSPQPCLEPLAANFKWHTVPYCAPAAFLGNVIFTFNEGIYCYDAEEERGNFIPLNISEPGDVLRSPVICDGELILLSKKGNIFILDLLAGSVIKQDKIQIKGVYSAPCVLNDNVYFEIFSEENHKRNAAAYCAKDGSLIIKEFENEVCSNEDLHFNFSPLVFQNNVLVASDIYPIFYHVRRIGDTIEIVPLELDIQVGNQKIVRVSHEFSTVIGSYIISKCEGGFFYVNLDNPSHNRIENLMSEMAAQPIVDRRKIYILCQGGIEIFQF
jgi:tetratricopeptide (TPR) repeat protein